MKIKSLFIVLTMTLISCTSDEVKVEKVDEIFQEEEETDLTPDEGVMRNLTSMEFVAGMKPGWNLGNALDTESTNETAWGNPATTKAMIDAIKERGFETIRIPVTWSYHTGASPEYIIEESWLNRVQEVVNYARDNDMYVIINIHHDDTWIIPTYALADSVKSRLNKTWTQIANRFKEYSDYLIFELLNEPRHENTPLEWTGGTPEGRDVVNQYNKTCLDAIRATGGNNLTRHIMMASYAASPGTVNHLVIPDDERIIVSIHNYFPFEFSIGNGSTWGTDQDKVEMDRSFDNIRNKFIANGKPVIMGEWSSTNNAGGADRLAHAEYYANGCVERGILPVWWDNGNIGGSGIFNRDNLTWYFPEIADAVINSKN